MTFDDELKFENVIVDFLRNQCGWEKEVIKFPTEEDLIQNWANILYENNKEQYVLNNCPLTEGEINQILVQVNTLKNPVQLNRFINGKTISIVRDNKDDILNFGKSVSLKIYDRNEIAGGKSRYQIVEQPRFKTNNSIYPARRGDIMLLINGMPLYHIELKKSGVPISQATNQIEKYMNAGIFTGIFSLVQIFVAMNPEESVYFANPGYNGRFKKEFFFHWEDFNNEIVNEWQEFTRKMLSIPIAHEIIGFYTIPDSSDGILKVMRSYQIEASTRIFDKVEVSPWTKESQNGGYIWHTTGSGKTLTSYKAAQLIANSNKADKVIFLLDRIELGTQSLLNYRNFASGMLDIQETENTENLISKLKSEENEDRLIVTSIQKMSRIKDDFVFRENDIKTIRSKKIVFIVDECHRSQMGTMHQNIKDLLPNAMYFGFTGTPLIKEIGDIAEDNIYTSDIFGDEIHRYTLFHGIRDKNVLGFDPYIISTLNEKELREVVGLEKSHSKNISEAMADSKKRSIFLYYMNQGDKKCDMEEIEKEIPSSQYRTEEHEEAVVNDIIKNWTIRSVNSKFHSIFATSSISEAILYYNLFKRMNSNLRITAIFDPSDNNSNEDINKIEGITEILTDYNNMFSKGYTASQYNNFKKDVSLRLAHKECYLGIENKPEEQLNLVIVVDQLLTGFDSKWINTLYFDKEQEGKNLIQSISRTNRLFGPDKPHGTIIFYRRPNIMNKKLRDAVRLYAGEEPYGVFVDKLPSNLQKINLKYQEIKAIFESAQIYNFERIDNSDAWKKKFAKLFNELKKYLDSAIMQGFRWNKLTYEFYDDSMNSQQIDVDIDERKFLILVQRYKEIFSSGSGGTEIPPYDIDTTITEIKTDSIDDEYMDSMFNVYLKVLTQGDEESKQKALIDLHSSFASLSDVEQKYAKIFLHQLESGDIEITKNKTFHDYIIELQKKYNDDFIHKISDDLGIDEEKFRKMISSGFTSKNINEFGRYDELIATLDIQKAKIFYESKKNKTLTLREVKILADKEITEIILNGGIDKATEDIILEEAQIEIYSEEKTEDLAQIAEDSTEYFIDNIGKFKTASGRNIYYYGEEFGDEIKNISNEYLKIENLNSLFAILLNVWKKETAYLSEQNGPKYNKENNPTYGQSAITVIIVHDLFGGSIHKIKLSDGGVHYFNKINGHYIDLTRDQFDLYNIDIKYEPNEEIAKEEYINYEDTLSRYNLLINYIENSIK